MVLDENFRQTISTPIITDHGTTNILDLISNLFKLATEQHHALAKCNQSTLEINKEYFRIKRWILEIFPPDNDEQRNEISIEEIQENTWKIENSFQFKTCFNVEKPKVMVGQSIQDDLSVFPEESYTVEDKTTFSKTSVAELNPMLNELSDRYCVFNPAGVNIESVKFPVKIEVITDKTDDNKSTVSLVKPMTVVNKKPQSVQNCKICYREFKVPIFTKEPQSLHVCGKCHNKYNNLQKFTDGLLREQCNTKLVETNFPTASKFCMAKRVMVDGSDLNHQCVYCNYSSKAARNLQKHMMVHSGKRDHKCLECGKSFTRSDHLKRHMRIHTGEKPYKCMFCNYTCARTCHLKTHMGSHTNSRPFTCYYCDKEFGQVMALRLHVKTHSKKEVYMCNYCPDIFHQIPKLLDHVKDHLKADFYKIKQTEIPSNA